MTTDRRLPNTSAEEALAALDREQAHTKAQYEATVLRARQVLAEMSAAIAAAQAVLDRPSV